MGAIQFIENLDKSSLTCDDAEFEKHVEEAVKRIAEKRDPLSPVVTTINENPSGSSDASTNNPRRDTSVVETQVPNGSGPGPSSAEEETAAISGLLKTIQKPLSTIGRIFYDDSATSYSSSPPNKSSLEVPSKSHPVATPLPGNTPRATPSPQQATTVQNHDRMVVQGFPGAAKSDDSSSQPQQSLFSAEESAARQASAETAEAARIERKEHENVVG